MVCTYVIVLYLGGQKCGSHEQILELAKYHTRLETNHKNQLNCRSAVGRPIGWASLRPSILSNPLATCRAIMLDFGFSKNGMSDGVKGRLFRYGIRYCLCNTGTEPQP
jgi:hypothetical protein